MRSADCWRHRVRARSTRFLPAPVLMALLGGVALAQSPFRFEQVSPETLRLTEAGQPVFEYHPGVMLPPGVPEDRARCCYVHPVWAPNGVVLTDDFPRDHYHHRGIFWAWPVVRIGGEQYDLWTIKGIHQRPLKTLAEDTLSHSAVLAVQNGWFLGERQVVRETVRITVHPAAGGSRRLDFDLAWEAAGAPVVLRGDPTDSKGYGGFSVRFAPREHTTIVTDRGRAAGDSNMESHAWAEQSGRFEKGQAALRIDIDPGHPGFPNGWCIRHYGFLGVNFPGNETYRLAPGQPLRLKYTVTVQSR